MGRGAEPDGGRRAVLRAGGLIRAVGGDAALARHVAGWLVGAFGGIPGARTPEAMAALILAPAEGPTACFVAFEGGEPAGTASLVRQDLESRPDLSPWLAGVFVAPGFRGRGLATRLVRHVEAHAAAAGIPALWLYTAAADGLYARLGWQGAGQAVDPGSGKPVRLMRRELAA